MLINIQGSGSVYVASAYEWRNIFNRTIKLGARPLVILRPFGPVAFVFELNDTEGYDPFLKNCLTLLKRKVNWRIIHRIVTKTLNLMG